MNQDFSKDEQVILEAILNARKVQDFIFGDRSTEDEIFSVEFWRQLFQKRVDSISELNIENPSAKIELRKRLLQQAALSVRALVVLEKGAALKK